MKANVFPPDVTELSLTVEGDVKSTFGKTEILNVR